MDAAFKLKLVLSCHVRWHLHYTSHKRQFNIYLYLYSVAWFVWARSNTNFCYLQHVLYIYIRSATNDNLQRPYSTVWSGLFDHETSRQFLPDHILQHLHYTTSTRKDSLVSILTFLCGLIVRVVESQPMLTFHNLSNLHLSATHDNVRL